MRKSISGVATAAAMLLLSGAALTAASSAAGQDAADSALLAGGGAHGHRFVDRHGLVLKTEQLYLIYWGSPWTRASLAAPTAYDVTDAARRILASSYMTDLGQYRGVGRGQVRGSIVLGSSEPPQEFSDDDVGQFVRDRISDGTLPGPDDGNQTLYAVVMPPDVKPEYTAWSGEHNTLGGHGRGIHYAWFASAGALSVLTPVMSHEIVEAATDPEGTGFLGVRGTCQQEGWCEIADICHATGDVDGVVVESYWSDGAGECVIPTAPAQPGGPMWPVHPAAQNRPGALGISPRTRARSS